MDQRNVKKIEDDSKILKGIWKLLDEADIVITQNGKRFDEKKLNARFILMGLKPPSSYRHIDTRQIAKKKFAFTSNSLEYMSDKLCKKYRKLKHKRFPGFELWSECIKNNTKAWQEMQHYNKQDVLATEELYLRFRPWDNSINFNVYSDSARMKCSCGASDFAKSGFRYMTAGKFQRLTCRACGSEMRTPMNELSLKRRKSMFRV